MPDNSDNFVKQLIQSGKTQLDKAVSNDYSSSFDKWIKSPSVKLYDYTKDKMHHTSDKEASYYEKLFKSHDSKESHGWFSLSAIKSSIVGGENLLKSSFSYISGWTGSLFGSKLSAEPHSVKDVVQAKQATSDGNGALFSYVSNFVKETYNKTGSLLVTSKDYLMNIDKEGSIREGINSGLSSTVSHSTDLVKGAYSKSGEMLSSSKAHFDTIKEEGLKPSFSNLKNKLSESVSKSNSAIKSIKDSFSQKAKQAVCVKDGVPLKAGTGALSGSAAAIAVNDASGHMEKVVVESIPKADVPLKATSNHGTLLLDNTKQTPGMVKPPSTLLRGFDYTKNALLSAGSTLNNNKLLLSSIILAGLLFNEVGARYAKKKSNSAYNILSYKDMNKNVVLVFGSMLDPITKLEVEDLLNRGFIVYVSSVDAKNSPFPEDVLLTSNDYSEVKESLNGNVSSNLKQRKNSEILSDISSEDEDHSTDGSFKKISDSDWIVSSAQCFSNKNATSQDFTRLNYITNSNADIKALAELIKEKNWNLSAIVFSYDNVSNNIKSSSDNFKDLILNNMMDMMSTLVKASQMWTNTKIILFNNSLSKLNEANAINNQNKKCEPSLQVLCNNLVETMYDTLTQGGHKNVYLINIGILKDAEGRNINYRDLSAKLNSCGKKIGTNIFGCFLNPVQNIIMDMTSSGVFYDFGSKSKVSCGSLSTLNGNLKLILSDFFILKFILMTTNMITFSNKYASLFSEKISVNCNKVKGLISRGKD